MFRAALVPGVAIVFAATGCDFVSTPAKSPVSALVVVAGDAQQGAAGEELPDPVEVKAVDDGGRAMPGQPITFVVTSGGGSVSSASASTDGEGMVSVRWTLGNTTSAPQHLEARVEDAGGNPLVVASVAATAQPGPATALVKIGGDAQTGTPGDRLTDSLRVKLTDRFGNAVAGDQVTWTTTSGTIAPQASTTRADGTAAAAWVLGSTVASYSASASHPGITTVTFTAGTSFGGATLTKTGGDNQSGAVGAVLAQPLTVQLLAGSGQPIQGATVRWNVADGSGTASPTTSQTDASGNAQTEWTMPNSTGPMTVTADVQDRAAATFSATAVAGAAAALAKVNGDLQTGEVGAALPDTLAVQLKDAAGNPVAGASVSWSVAAGGGTFAAPQSITNADGVASAHWTLGLRADTTHVATASAAGLPPVSFDATPHLPPTLSFTKTGGDAQSGTVSAALTDSLETTIKLTDGRAVEGVRITWSTTSGTVTAGRPRSAADGTVRAAWTFGVVAGPQTAVARWLNDQGAAVDSVMFTATAALGSPTSPPTLTITAPANWSVARPDLRLAAGCAFGGRACNVTARVNGAVVATAANSMDQTVSLGSYDGTDVQLVYCAEDPSNTVPASCAGRDIAVEASTHLSEVGTVPAGKILDADAQRLVYVADSAATLGSTYCSGGRVCQGSGSPALSVLARSNQAVQLIAGETAGWARLAGATTVLWQNAQSHTMEWRGGSSSDLGAIGTPNVRGAFATWVAPGTSTVTLRDAGAGVSVTVSQFGASPRVTAAGDVWYAANRKEDGTDLRTWQIFDYSAGNYTQVTNDTLHDNAAPVSDGTRAVFWRQTPNAPTTYAPLVLWSGGTETGVTDTAGAAYDIRNGWVFFAPRGSGVDQIFSRAPNGTTRQVTVFGTLSTPEAFGDNGEVMFVSSSRRYLATPGYTAPPVDVMNTHGQRVTYSGGKFYVALGRSLFEVR